MVRWRQVDRLPEHWRPLGSSATVALGLTVAGFGTLAMMALAARALPPVAYAAFAVWWTVATLLGFAFGAFEAYFARLIVADVAAGRDPSMITGVLVGRTWLVAAVLSTGTLSLSPWLTGSLFAGSVGASLLLPAFIFLTATQGLQRGFATGQRRFEVIAAQLIIDGTCRVGFTALLVLLGGASLESLAAGSCLSAAVGIVAASSLSPGLLSHPRLRGSSVSTRPVILLLVGAVGPVLANGAAVPWLASTGSEDALTVGAFAGAMTLSRIPTQFASAAFGPLLAKLAHSVEAGDGHGYRRQQRRAGFGSAIFVLIFVGVFASAGPWILTRYLGPAYSLPLLTLALLALASGLMLSAGTLQASLAALECWGAIAWAWSVGAVLFTLVLLLPSSALHRATTAPLLAVLGALIFMAVARHCSTLNSKLKQT